MKINISAPNLVNICVDTVSEHEFSGRVYDYYQAQPRSFQKSGEMIFMLDRFFDEINFPQAACRERTFVKKDKIEQIDRKDKMKSSEQLLENKGAIATFVVHVQYRQNATWQGKIVWADKNKECSFRSALEMLKIMDGAVNDDVKEDINTDNITEGGK